MSATLSLLVALTLTTNTPTPDTCYVTRVIDGDTFVCHTGHRVRILYYDAPELPSSDGIMAKRELEHHISRRWVRLRPNPNEPNVDVYGRLLRHVDIDLTTLLEHHHR